VRIMELHRHNQGDASRHYWKHPYSQVHSDLRIVIDVDSEGNGNSHLADPEETAGQGPKI